LGLDEFVFCCAELRNGLLELLTGEGEELVVTTGCLFSTEYMKFLDSGIRLFTVMFTTYASGTIVDISFLLTLAVNPAILSITLFSILAGFAVLVSTPSSVDVERPNLISRRVPLKETDMLDI
jgi:hypothetical protein